MGKPFIGRGPDGEIIRGTKKYLTAWDKIIRPLEDRLNVKVYAFDPSIQIMRVVDGKPQYGTGIVDLPVWLAKKILEGPDAM